MENNIEVIGIASEKEIIINYGEQDGAVKGVKILIYTDDVEVYDSDKNSLGTRTVIKDKLTIVDVYKKFSMCRKPEELTSRLFNTSIPSTYADLKVDMDQVCETDLIIKLGDKVEILAK